GSGFWTQDAGFGCPDWIFVICVNRRLNSLLYPSISPVDFSFDQPKYFCSIAAVASTASSPQVEFSPTIVPRRRQSANVVAISSFNSKTTSAAIATVSTANG